MTCIEGRPIAESRRIAARIIDRYERLGGIWDDLTEDEQIAVLSFARSLADKNQAEYAKPGSIDLNEGFISPVQP